MMKENNFAQGFPASAEANFWQKLSEEDLKTKMTRLQDTVRSLSLKQYKLVNRILPMIKGLESDQIDTDDEK